ncbi:MAG: hypothetical protein NXI31_13840 [bacterium]|nr:hypothetical protein [bacterium]
MLLRSLPIVALAASLAAQTPVLQYDNGPLETQSMPGFSDLQFAAPYGLNIYGYGAQLVGTTTNNSVFDDFEVAGAMIIDEIELYCYQTGAGSGASTITGCSVAFYDSDPSQQATLTEMAGSPLFTTDLMATPNNPVSNAWSGLYRTLDGNMATNRAIMAVRVKLEDAAGNATPLVLTNGRYWIRLQASGSAASGPWFPPVTCENQVKTGDGMQLVTAGTFNNPIVSGGQGQAIPFKLFGQGSTPGSITEVATNNHGLTLSVCGSPNTGGFFRAELSGNDPAALPIIGFDFSANVTQVCNSNFVHAFPISILLATDSTVEIPLGLFGVTIGVQAAELTVPPVAPGACFGSANISNGFAVVINT